jgi:hypothetical protein
MRNASGVAGVVLVVALAACGGDGKPAGDGAADGRGPDAPGTGDAGTAETPVERMPADGVAGDSAIADGPAGVDAPDMAVDPGDAPRADAALDAPADAAPACVPVADRVISDVAGRSGRPSLAWTGDGYGVVWPDDRSGAEQIFFARLDRAGAAVGAQVPVTSGPTAATLPDLVWAADTFGLSYVTEAATTPQVHFVRLAAAGAPMGTVADMPGAGINSLVWTGQHYALAYHSARGGAQTEVFVSRFDAAGARVGTELQLTMDPAASFIPSIAWSGTRYGVTFQDSRPGSGHVFLGIVDGTGAEVGAEASITPAGGGASSIGASGSGFAVSYGGPAGARLARLGLDGQRTVAEDVPIGGAPAQLVWTGTKYAFAWSDAGKAVYLATIDPAGGAASSPLLVSDAGAAAGVNAVALVSIGNGYAVVWRDDRTANAETRFAIVCPP